MLVYCLYFCLKIFRKYILTSYFTAYIFFQSGKREIFFYKHINAGCLSQYVHTNSQVIEGHLTTNIPVLILSLSHL